MHNDIELDLVYSDLFSFFLNTALPCNVMLTPSNGKIVGCTSGSMGLGHVGDICYLECNNGYEMVGNSTRTCQSDGNWSGTDTTCIRGG